VLLSIKTYLNPAWLESAHIETVKTRLSTAALVVIRDAFQPGVRRTHVSVSRRVHRLEAAGKSRCGIGTFQA
jgi:hypothetical protein